MNPFSNIGDIASLSGYEFETACRQHIHYAYLGNYTGLCKILTRYNIYVDTRDVGITPHLITDGFWETWLTQCLASIVQEGDVCIDIGANLGYYSLLLSALAGKQGRVIAIEPNPHICNLLRCSQSIHPFRFDVVQAAVSNVPGKSVLYIPEVYPGSASIQPLHDSLQSARQTKIKVSMITVDELVAGMHISKVDVVKIDTEGVEPLVFEGMRQTIANNPGLKIVLEYSPHLYSQAAAFTQYLFDHFNVYRIKDVDSRTLLDASAIPSLVQLKDHTDLFLMAK